MARPSKSATGAGVPPETEDTSNALSEALYQSIASVSESSAEHAAISAILVALHDLKARAVSVEGLLSTELSFIVERIKAL